MPSPLVEAHIEGEARLRAAVVAAVVEIWRSLSGYDREDVDEWLTQVVPVVEAGQRASAVLTAAFIAQALGRSSVEFDQDEMIGAAVRNGTPPAEVYQRPFVTLWSGLGAGLDFKDASNKALARATGAAAMDVQLTMRATADAVERAEPGLFGFERVADPTACEFCREVDGAYVKRASAMPLHNYCGCGLQPLTEPHPLAAELPSGVAVHEHGELGPVLGSPDHDFISVSDL